MDNTLEARMKDSAVEADIEADPNVKTTCNVYTGNSVEAQDYDMYGHRISSYLTTSPDGGLMRVQAGAISDKVLVEYYDNSYNIQRTVTVPHCASSLITLCNINLHLSRPNCLRSIHTTKALR